jgi:hypothetical protein
MPMQRVAQKVYAVKTYTLVIPGSSTSNRCNRDGGDDLYENAVLMLESSLTISTARFKGCTSLTGVELSEKVTELSSSPFYPTLTRIELRGMSVLTKSMFADYALLTELKVAGASSIADETLKEFKSLVRVELSTTGAGSIPKRVLRVFGSC